MTAAAGIRRVVASDWAAVLALAAGGDLFDAEELTELEQLLDVYLAGAAGPGYGRWIVDATIGGPAGLAYYAPERMADGTWNLLLLAVSPTVRGAGRGAALVRHVEAELQAEGARVLLIETSCVEAFAAQRRFYLRRGYRQEASIQDFYVDGDDKVIFWKSLTSST